MFSDILDFFDDFPQTPVKLYRTGESYNPATGEITDGVILLESGFAWGFQKSTVRNYIRDKIFDEVDLVFVFDMSFSQDAKYIKHGDLWYLLKYPDNVAFADGAYIVGAVRTEKPAGA